MSSPTFKRLRQETITDPLDGRKKIKVRRWRLLKDLPHFGLQAGAITGYLDSRSAFTDDDECWIGKYAIVYGNVTMKGRVQIGDTAVVRGPDLGSGSTLVIRGNAKIYQDAIVGYEKFEVKNRTFIISGNTHISGQAKLDWPDLIDGADIKGLCRVERFLKARGDVNIYGDAKIGSYATLIGNIHISEYASLRESVTICSDINVSGNSTLYAGYNIENGEIIHHGNPPKAKKTAKELPFFNNGEIFETSVFDDGLDNEDDDSRYKDYRVNASEASHESPDETIGIHAERHSNAQHDISPERKQWQDRFMLVKEQLDSYESDIVKLIRYPLMTDLTNEYTADMAFSLREIEVHSSLNDEQFAAAVLEFERKFLIAESHARKIASTLLTVDEKKKTENAKDLFAIACNEASSETEKKASLKQGFARLEGVISVPEKAIMAMQHKVGLAEIEM